MAADGVAAVTARAAGEIIHALPAIAAAGRGGGVPGESAIDKNVGAEIADAATESGLARRAGRPVAIAGGNRAGRLRNARIGAILIESASPKRGEARIVNRAAQRLAA